MIQESLSEIIFYSSLKLIIYSKIKLDDIWKLFLKFLPANTNTVFQQKYCHFQYYDMI